MNELFAAAIDRKEASLLLDVPDLLLDPYEIEVKTWALAYKDKYGRLPTAERLAENFEPFRVKISYPKGDPSDDIIDRFVKKRQRERLPNVLSELARKIESGEHFDRKTIASLLEYTRAYSSKMVSLLDFSAEWFKTDEKSLRFGIPVIDHVTGGLGKGDYAVLVGRPGIGKTMFAVWLSTRWVMEGKRTLFLSKEMRFKDILARAAGMLTGTNPGFLRAGDFEDDDERVRTLESVRVAVSKYGGDIVTPRTPPEDVMGIESLAERGKYDLIVVDGLYLLNSTRPATAKWERVAEISNSLKDAAIRLEVPILGITQLKRGASLHDLTSEDIAYSDAIGQDADFIFALSKGDEEEESVLQMVKNRHGRKSSLGTTFRFVSDRMAIDIVEEDEDDDEW